MKSKLFIISAVTFILMSCSAGTHRFSTMGREYDIAMFSDEDFYLKYGEIIEKELSYPLIFTHTEPVFEIQKREIAQFANFRKHKNIVMIDDVSTDDPMTAFVRNALGDTVVNKVSGISVAHQKDIWIEGQSVLFILVNGSDYEKKVLASSIRGAHNVLYEYISERIKKGVASERMKKAFSKSVRNRFNFHMEIPARYNLLKAESDFLCFVTRTPDRLIFVTAMEDDGRKISRSSMIEMRNSLTNEYYEGDSIFEDFYNWAKESPENNYFQGFTVYDNKGTLIHKLYGLWENEKDMNGGPFVTYMFKKDGKIIVLDAVLFNPSGRKWPFINKLDALLKLNIDYILNIQGE